MRSLLEKCVGLNPNTRKPLDIGLIWEGNYWDDQDVHDCCDVDWETVEILIRKISKALRLPTAPEEKMEKIDNRREKILIFLPRVMQLPLTILAAFRAGYVGVVMDPLLIKPPVFSTIIQSENPKFVVTVDAFWQGQDLIELKKSIEKFSEDTQLLVIRHVAPNDGVPPPKRHFPGRRPSYRTSMDLREGKDWEWSTVMSGITVDEKGLEEEEDGEWKEDEVIMKMVEENGKIHEIRHQSLLDSLSSRLVGLEAKGGGASENIMVMDVPRDLETLTNFLIPWYMGKTMTLYEGPLDYPDSSRLSQIIQKHNVNIILGVEKYSIPNPEYLKFFPVPSLKIVEIPGFSDLEKWFSKDD
uniref:AMP-binding domain-containing protein n=1 Tax=Caenorhabditis tropicalis TaxID=1561998 RepID=A0A1I7ULP5_9PELO